VAGLPWEWNILQDSRRNVAIFDYYGASALTNESIVYLFHMQNLGCILNYSDNANWNISFGKCWKFFLINKQFCGNR